MFYNVSSTTNNVQLYSPQSNYATLLNIIISPTISYTLEFNLTINTEPQINYTFLTLLVFDYSIKANMIVISDANNNKVTFSYQINLTDIDFNSFKFYDNNNNLILTNLVDFNLSIKVNTINFFITNNYDYLKGYSLILDLYPFKKCKVYLTNSIEYKYTTEYNNGSSSISNLIALKSTQLYPIDLSDHELIIASIPIDANSFIQVRDENNNQISISDINIIYNLNY
jgi:hypothetical protein